MKRSTVVDGEDIPLGVLPAPANVNDSPLLAPTVDLVIETIEPGTATLHLDRGYDSKKTRRTLQVRALNGAIARRGVPAPLQAGQRWVVERTNSWHNAFKKLVWCTERKRNVIGFYIAFANAIIIVRRLMREGWKRYRWDTRHGHPRRLFRWP